MRFRLGPNGRWHHQHQHQHAARNDAIMTQDINTHTHTQHTQSECESANAPRAHDFDAEMLAFLAQGIRTSFRMTRAQAANMWRMCGVRGRHVRTTCALDHVGWRLMVKGCPKTT